MSPNGRFCTSSARTPVPTARSQEGNQLEILAVGPDGKLSEPNGPVILPADSVPGTAHPQGIAVVGGGGQLGLVRPAS